VLVELKLESVGGGVESSFNDSIKYTRVAIGGGFGAIADDDVDTAIAVAERGGAAD
jgi:hypothetical protein